MKALGGSLCGPREREPDHLPDAIALVVAEMLEADAVWTFDRRWRDVHQRVTIP
jgi:hypothetical protein